MNRQTFLNMGVVESPIAKIRKELDDAIEHLGITITDKNVEQVLRENPHINQLYLTLQEEQFGYRREADEFHACLTREQRRSWKACGPSRSSDGKRNPVHDNRSHWLCWLRKRAEFHALPKALAELINNEYHHV